MLWRFSGFQKSGKSLAAIAFLCKFYARGYPIVSNSKSLRIAEPLDLDVMLRMEFRNTVIFLDEAHQIFDPYQSNSTINRLGSYFATQVGKHHNLLVYATHMDGMIAPRIRHLTSMQFDCRTPDHGIHVFANALNIQKVKEAAAFNLDPPIPKWYVIYGPPYWNLYDCDEPFFGEEAGASVLASKSTQSTLDFYNQRSDRSTGPRPGRKTNAERFAEDLKASVLTEVKEAIAHLSQGQETPVAPSRRVMSREEVANILADESLDE